MKIKSLLIFVFTLMSLTAFAQSGGIKGKVAVSYTHLTLPTILLV